MITCFYFQLKPKSDINSVYTLSILIIAYHYLGLQENTANKVLLFIFWVWLYYSLFVENLCHFPFLWQVSEYVDEMQKMFLVMTFKTFLKKINKRNICRLIGHFASGKKTILHKVRDTLISCLCSLHYLTFICTDNGSAE